MKMREWLFSQNKVGLWLGGIKHSIGQIGIYVGFLNLFLLSITTYNTGWVQQWVNVSFLGFLAIVVGLVGVALLAAYKLDMPSYFGFWKKQVGLDEMEKRLERVEGQNKRILELLEKQP